MRKSEFERHLADLRSTLDDLERVYRLAGEIDRIRDGAGRHGKGAHGDPTATAVLDTNRRVVRHAQIEAARFLLHAEREFVRHFRALAKSVDATERALARRPSERLEGRFVTKTELEEARAYAEKRNTRT